MLNLAAMREKCKAAISAHPRDRDVCDVAVEFMACIDDAVAECSTAPVATKPAAFRVVRTNTLKVGDEAIDFYTTEESASFAIELYEEGSRAIRVDPVTADDLDCAFQWPYAVVTRTL